MLSRSPRWWLRDCAECCTDCVNARRPSRAAARLRCLVACGPTGVLGAAWCAVGPGCLVCPWAAARPRAVCAASFARRVDSLSGQAPPPPTGTAAGPSDTLHTSGAWLLACGSRVVVKPTQAPPWLSLLLRGIALHRRTMHCLVASALRAIWFIGSVSSASLRCGETGGTFASCVSAGLKPVTPLRVENGGFKGVEGLQRCRRFHWSARTGARWCRRFQRLATGGEQWCWRFHWPA